MSENTGVDMLHSCGWVQHGFKKLLKDQNKEREIESFAKIVVTGERWAIPPLERVFVVRWVLVLAVTFGEIRGSLSDPLIVRLLGPFWRLLQSSSQDLGVARFGICGREHNAPAQDKRSEHHKNHFPVWTDEFLASYFSFTCLFWSALQRMQKEYLKNTETERRMQHMYLDHFDKRLLIQILTDKLLLYFSLFSLIQILTDKLLLYFSLFSCIITTFSLFGQNLLWQQKCALPSKMKRTFLTLRGFSSSTKNAWISTTKQDS